MGHDHLENIMNEDLNIGEKAANALRTAAAQTKALGTETSISVLQKFHVINLAEIQIGSIALQRGHSASAREYGQRLVSDHERMERELTLVAKGLNVDLREHGTDDKTQDLREKLDGITSSLREAGPEEFDQLLGDTMYKAHKEALAMGKNAETDVASADVRQLLRQMIPMLEEHVSLAERVQAAAH